MDCIFCKIADKTLAAEVVREDELALAFLDIHPVTKGHTLIIPKQHFASMVETPDELISRLFKFSKKLMPWLQRAMGADYVAVSIVGIDVPHFHIHLIPRKLDDGLASFWPTTTYEAGEASQIAEMIRRSL